ncbi:type II toxin-antitoxin system RelE family toxin [Piscicoccus intestinalis]|uniref:type II toxin-antitoxin system RelE family toxin n=1 Tax=Piscicoccus intestinalis TaxID=746033 RepID=UPI00278C0227|nr:type II toxin-antitoxin system RelE/ParE family toxin [Piscicoccus intestinalis]
MELLAQEPRPPGAKKLAGGDGEWRVRTGNYRIIYEIDDGVLVVLVLGGRSSTGDPPAAMTLLAIQ